MKRTKKAAKPMKPRPLLQEFQPIPGAPFQVCPVWEGSYTEANFQALLKNPDFAQGLEEYLKEWGFRTLREPLEALAELNEHSVELQARIDELEQDRYVVVDPDRKAVLLCENWKDAIETLWSRLNLYPTSQNWDVDCNPFELEEGDEVELNWVGDGEEQARPEIVGLHDFLSSYFHSRPVPAPVTETPPAKRRPSRPKPVVVDASYRGPAYITSDGNRFVCSCGNQVFDKVNAADYRCKCGEVYVDGGKIK